MMVTVPEVRLVKWNVCLNSSTWSPLLKPRWNSTGSGERISKARKAFGEPFYGTISCL